MEGGISRQVGLKQLPALRISASDLDHLIAALQIKCGMLAEQVVAETDRAEYGCTKSTSIFYILEGNGTAYVGNGEPIVLRPHMLIVTPANASVKIGADQEIMTASVPNDGLAAISADKAGMDEESSATFCERADLRLISGHFSANYGETIELFGSLAETIVEIFTSADQMERKLKYAISEFASGQVGSAAMASTILKGIIVTLLRRSLRSSSLWVGRFTLLSDQQITRAFSEMVANPGASHTIATLSRSAALSRSAFMARFTELTGQSPMLVLRSLRLKMAAKQLWANTYSIDQVAHNAGYGSRSSFVRAFRKAYDQDPSDYREARRIGRDGANIMCVTMGD